MQEIIDVLKKTIEDLTLENTQLKNQLKFEQIKNAKNKQIIAGLLDENISHASTIDILSINAQEAKAVADAIANEKKTEQLEEPKKEEANLSQEKIDKEEVVEEKCEDITEE